MDQWKPALRFQSKGMFLVNHSSPAEWIPLLASTEMDAAIQAPMI
jgi:hypothetical protein